MVANSACPGLFWRDSQDSPLWVKWWIRGRMVARLAAQMETPTSIVDHMEISTVASVGGESG